MRKLLYSNGSPFARRVRVVLMEKGLEFEPDVNETPRPIDEMRKHNPVLQLPVFYDGDRHLFGSNLILQDSFATYPNPVPTPGVVPLAPTMTRADRHWDDMQILTAIETTADAVVALRPLIAGGEGILTYLNRHRTRIASSLDWLEERATPQGFWPGLFSIMDINLMFPLLYGEKRGTFLFRTGQWPKLTAMIDQWLPRPSVAATPVGDLPVRPPG